MGAGVSEKKGDSCDTEGRTTERTWAGDRVREGTHNRPAPVVKRNGAKRTRKTSVPAAWEEEIEK